MKTTKDLSLLQRGFLQRVFIFSIYCIYGAFSLHILSWFIKIQIITLLKEAVKTESISPETLFQASQQLEKFNLSYMGPLLFLLLALCIIGYFLMRFSTRLKLVKQVVLPEAIEFSSAMRLFDIVDPKAQLEFIRKYKLLVFIADTPILEERAENVVARLYPFAGHLLFNPAIFDKNFRNRTLCVDAADFEELTCNIREQLQLQIAEKNKEIAYLSSKNQTTGQELQKAVAELEKLQADLQRASAREGKQVTANIRNIPFWMIAVPLMRRLRANARPGQKYTRTEIQNEFIKEMKKHPDWKPVGVFTEDGSLKDWVMETLRAGLDELVVKTSGRPVKQG